MTAHAPSTLDALVDAVATTAPAPLRIAGGGTTRPRRHDDARPEADVVDLSALTGLAAYDPAECVVTVLAGTPVPVSYTHLTLPTNREV